MGNKITNTFEAYELSEQEQVQASILTTLQKQQIHNQRTIVAEEKLMLTFDPMNPMDFALQDAYKRGMLDILTQLLELSTASEELLKTQHTKEANHSEE